MSDAIIERVTRMIAPLIADLKLDLYDIEFRGGTLRVTLDTPPGSPGGVDIDTLALVTRMISRDFDHDDPMPGHYTLEVTSPGLERTLRVPAHFQREVGKTVAIRLRDTAGSERRVQGTLIAATDTECTVRIEPEVTLSKSAAKRLAAPVQPDERTIAYTQIDRAKTVFVWGPAPKPGKQPTSKSAAKSPASDSRSKASHAKTAGPSDEVDESADIHVPTSATQEAS